MLIIKIAPIFLLALAVVAEKKIELQDIEEDNLKSEKESEDKPEGRSQSSGADASQGLVPLEFLKNGLLRYFESPTQQQPQRYVQQYAVTEPPERAPPTASKLQYASPTAQQAMVGYLSNVPMQIYLVPQYYNEPAEQAAQTQPAVPYTAPGIARIAAYQTAPEAIQPQANYVEVPTYVTPTGKTYIQQYTQPVAYVSYAQPTAVIPAQTTVAPVLTYQMPVVQYPTAISAPPVVPKEYYQQQQYSETTTGEEVHENEIESPQQYSTQTEVPYTKITQPEFPRYYNSRTPIREEHRHGSVSELPHPNPLLLKSSPPHLAHIPKVLPIYRPITKPVYTSGGGIISNSYTQRPHEVYGVPYKRRPTSLLDSYIPSSVQIEYLKKGYVKDPVSAYEALSSGRHFTPIQYPRHYERGFLPNQMYQTASGGITFGHYKRTPKLDPVSQG